MKIFNIIITVTLVLGLAASGMGFEGNGAGDGTGPIQNILGGEPVTISGTVSNVGTYGEGVQIDTGDAIVTVYGIGPLFYWEDQGIARLSVDEDIIVVGVTVAFSDGSTKIVAESISIGGEIIGGEIIGGETIQLRDKETGLPLWRQNRQKRGGMMKHEEKKGFRNQTCPAADVNSEGV